MSFFSLSSVFFLFKRRITKNIIPFKKQHKRWKLKNNYITNCTCSKGEKIATSFFYGESVQCYSTLNGCRNALPGNGPRSAPPHLLAPHQEEIHSSDVDADVVTEILEDVSYGSTRSKGNGRAGPVWKQHAAVFGRTFPHSN